MRVFIFSQKHQFERIKWLYRIMLIDQMAIRAEWNEIHRLVIRGIFINVMQLRMISTAHCAAMVELVKNFVFCGFRNILSDFYQNNPLFITLQVIPFFPFPANPLKFSPVTNGLPERFSTRRMNPTATVNSLDWAPAVIQ